MGLCLSKPESGSGGAAQRYAAPTEPAPAPVQQQTPPTSSQVPVQSEVNGSDKDKPSSTTPNSNQQPPSALESNKQTQEPTPHALAVATQPAEQSQPDAGRAQLSSDSFDDVQSNPAANRAGSSQSHADQILTDSHERPQPADNQATTSQDASGDASGELPNSPWDKAKMLFSLTKPEALFTDLHDLKYIGAGGYGKVFKVGLTSLPADVVFAQHVKIIDSHVAIYFLHVGCLEVSPGGSQARAIALA